MLRSTILDFNQTAPLSYTFISVKTAVTCSCSEQICPTTKVGCRRGKTSAAIRLSVSLSCAPRDLTDRFAYETPSERTSMAWLASYVRLGNHYRRSVLGYNRSI